MIARVEDPTAYQVQILNKFFAICLQIIRIGDLWRIDFEVLCRVDNRLDNVTQCLLEIRFAYELHIRLDRFGCKTIATEYETCVFDAYDLVDNHVAQILFHYLQFVCNAYERVGQIVFQSHVQMRLEHLDYMQIVFFDVLYWVIYKCKCLDYRITQTSWNCGVKWIHSHSTALHNISLLPLRACRSNSTAGCQHTGIWPWFWVIWSPLYCSGRGLSYVIRLLVSPLEEPSSLATLPKRPLLPSSSRHSQHDTISQCTGYFRLCSAVCARSRPVAVVSCLSSFFSSHLFLDRGRCAAVRFWLNFQRHGIFLVWVLGNNTMTDGILWQIPQTTLRQQYSLEFEILAPKQNIFLFFETCACMDTVVDKDFAEVFLLVRLLYAVSFGF